VEYIYLSRSFVVSRDRLSRNGKERKERVGGGVRAPCVVVGDGWCMDDGTVGRWDGDSFVRKTDDFDDRAVHG
jgi:hypothetical protein